MRMGAEVNMILTHSLKASAATEDHRKGTNWEVRAVRGAATEV